MLIHRLCLLACMVVPSALAQAAPASPTTDAAFSASLVKLRRVQIAEWRRSLEQIEIEHLQLGYPQGKLIERTRDEALQWLIGCDATASLALQTQELGDYIRFLGMTIELNHSMERVVQALDLAHPPNGATGDLKNKWENEIRDLAHGPISELSRSALDFSVARADELEKQCHRLHQAPPT
jgi:hypothetical protein